MTLWTAFGGIVGSALTQEVVQPTALLQSRIAADGDYPTLPVTIGDECVSFVVDTGSWTTTLDAQFRAQLTPATEAAAAKSDEYKDYPGLYMPPRIIFRGTDGGALPFPAGWPVACRDFSDLRQASNIPIHGIVAMDFLESYALEIDLSQGWLRLLDPATVPRCGHDAEIKIVMTRRRPFIPVELHGTADWAVIDTGALVSLTVRRELYRELVERDHLRERLFEVQAKGQKTIKASPEGWLLGFQLGPFSHRSLFVWEADQTLLGLYYLRRYRCMFDFPGRTMYLDKGPYYDVRDDTGHAGIYVNDIVKPPGSRRVEYVALGSEGHYYGVRSGDLLLSINGRNVAGDSIYYIFRQLSFRQNARELILRRDGEDVRVTIPATERQAEP